MRIDAGLNSVADFKAVPEGVYELMIGGPVKVTPIEGKQTDLGSQAYTFEFPTVIASGPHQGRELRNQKANSSKGARYFLLALVRGLGVNVGADGSFDTDEIFVGCRFRALVTIRKVEDKEKSTLEKKVYRDYNEIDVESVQRVA